MTQSIIAIDELRRIAIQHAMAVVDAQASSGTGETLHGELLQEFQRSRQPFLSGKQYTALYRTYSDMVLVAIANHYTPGSAVEQSPVQISSIRDGNEIYRPNSVAMKHAQWDAYIHEVVAMAERFAHEVAVLAVHGGDTKARMEEQQFEAAKFSLDRGLTDDEMNRQNAIYKDAFLKALERAVNEKTGKA
jgi:hypothetical protein